MSNRPSRKQKSSHAGSNRNTRPTPSSTNGITLSIGGASLGQKGFFAVFAAFLSLSAAGMVGYHVSNRQNRLNQNSHESIDHGTAKETRNQPNIDNNQAPSNPDPRQLTDAVTKLTDAVAKLLDHIEQKDRADRENEKEKSDKEERIALAKDLAYAKQDLAYAKQLAQNTAYSLKKYQESDREMVAKVTALEAIKVAAQYAQYYQSSQPTEPSVRQATANKDETLEEFIVRAEKDKNSITPTELVKYVDMARAKSAGP